MRSAATRRPGATTLIERDGEPIAALMHDPALDDEPELLDAVSAAAGIALENGRLQAELRARLEELQGSRGRVIEAGQQERQRLERNLHDGAQQRLIALSLELGAARSAGSTTTRRRGRGSPRARREIALSLDELRDVARGLHPAVVSGHGLAVALESLAATAPVPVRLEIALDRAAGRAGSRSPPTTWSARASPTSASTPKRRRRRSSVAQENGDLVVEVLDDGVGGADTERGSGLRGLADRVEALGGRLQIWTPRGGGTRVRAQIPCG